MIPVRLFGHRGKSVDTYALLDSGADYCIFHANWARKIGLDLYTGRKEPIHGIIQTSQEYAYFHRIDIMVGSVKVRCDIAFSEDIGEEMNDQLIGRDVVFNQIRFAIRQKKLSIYSSPE
jgi:hypothetical protein